MCTSAHIKCSKITSGRHSQKNKEREGVMFVLDIMYILRKMKTKGKKEKINWNLAQFRQNVRFVLFLFLFCFDIHIFIVVFVFNIVIWLVLLLSLSSSLSLSLLLSYSMLIYGFATVIMACIPLFSTRLNSRIVFFFALIPLCV